jgi:hypothetical protein
MDESIIEKLSSASVLSDHSFSQNIRAVSNIYKSFIILDNEKYIFSYFDEINNKKMFYLDNMYYYLKNKISSMI